MYSKQQTFDRVAKFLLRQSRESKINASCVYFGPGDLKCAAGCLIPPKRYSKKLEGFLVDENVSLLKMPNWFGHSTSLVTDLQGIHDNCLVREWKQELKAIAKYHKLDDSALKQFRWNPRKNCYRELVVA